MTVMPEQNPLPFPDGQPSPPSTAAADTGATTAALPLAEPVPPAVSPSIAPRVAAARRAQRPGWARPLGPLAAPWLRRAIVAGQAGRVRLGGPGGGVV
ncbi:glycerol-3-phosphate 1-O-acyltransferase, partial [Xanthomonas perforans]